MPSFVHHGGNSFAAAFFGGLLARLDRGANLDALSVQDEFTSDEGIRSDTEYIMTFAGQRVPVLRQETCYSETLPHSTRKCSKSQRNGWAPVLGFVIVCVHERKGQRSKPNRGVLDHWKAGVEARPPIPNEWGEWGCRTWEGGRRYGRMVEAPLQWGQTTDVFEGMFKHHTVPAVTFNGHVVHGETDATIVLIRPPQYGLLHKAESEGWDRRRILSAFPHVVSTPFALTPSWPNNHPQEIRRNMVNTTTAPGFLDEVGLLLRCFWDVTVAMREYLHGGQGTTIETLSPRSKRLVKRFLGIIKAEHQTPNPANAQSYSDVMDSTSLTESAINDTANSLSNRLLNLIQAVGAVRVKTWIYHGPDEEEASGSDEEAEVEEMVEVEQAREDDVDYILGL
ncbi:uncharacterized protein B0H18DRAFT_1126013 [Fomitopsis serialis]|uniref:uncharacterized protein n=1 Tax=Fomitopsis serialis TaxID=139415 RepID=UPI002007F840|nr:uncharacterized protein B0H18DRAFT_1126013 [Neoantrodia serialis]KAH9913776.1 hypothetical protein B0H18DRAFT_1126013 [Neoantrodia serialis]